jgi:hypothetical protein
MANELALVKQKLKFKDDFIIDDFKKLLTAYDLIRSGRNGDGMQLFEQVLTVNSDNWRSVTDFGNKPY